MMGPIRYPMAVETYHSQYGAIQESQHVFIESGTNESFIKWICRPNSCIRSWFWDRTKCPMYDIGTTTRSHSIYGI